MCTHTKSNTRTYRLGYLIVQSGLSILKRVSHSPSAIFPCSLKIPYFYLLTLPHLKHSLSVPLPLHLF